MAAARRRPSGEFLRQRSLEESLDRVDARGALDSESDHSGTDLLDVPATVVCAFCGDADCAGCENELSRSGIVAVVAWERPAMPMFARLWSTARSTTRDAEGFFELLPDGPLMPALRFAATCELLASLAIFTGFVALAAVVAPGWLSHVAFDPALRRIAVRAVVVGLPAFACLAVIAHAAHGLAINLGATRNGGRSARSRALRFGLYACGWDLVMGPVGAIVVAIKEGAGAAFGLASMLSGLPTRATKSFLRGCYRLDGERAVRALATSYLGAGVATLFVAVVVLFAIVAAAFA